MKKMILMLAGAAPLPPRPRMTPQYRGPKVATAPTAADKAAVVAKENSIALGLTMTDGNSDTLLTTASALHDRKRDAYTLRLGLRISPTAEDQDEKITENVKARGRIPLPAQRARLCVRQPDRPARRYRGH